MGTNTPGNKAQRYHQHMVHYLRKQFTWSMGSTAGSSFTVGYIPAGSVILKPDSGVFVHSSFASTKDMLQIGTAGASTLFSSTHPLDVVGFYAAQNNVAGFYRSSDTRIVGTLVRSTVDTSGKGQVIIAYIPPST